MKELKNVLTILAVIGNILYILWILYNGINEGFEGTLLEIISYITLMGLLAVNTILLLSGRSSSTR
jgi:hypothetical protein